MTTAEGKRGNVKQRSLNLSDEDYKLLTDYADRLGLTNGAALRVILRTTIGGEAPTPFNLKTMTPGDPAYVPVSAGPVQADGTAEAIPAGGKGIVLPDPKQTSFAIPSKFRERGGLSIRDRQRMAGVPDIDLDGE